MISVSRTSLSCTPLLALALLSASNPVRQRRSASVSGILREEYRPQHSLPRCYITSGRRVNLRLANGDIPWVAATSHARLNSEWLVMGSPSYVWPADSPWTYRPSAESFLGFVLSPSRSPVMVPNPLRGGHVRFPRVASTAKGWRSLLFQSHFPNDGMHSAADTVTVWYGEYSRSGWREIRPIALVVGARVQPDYASRLVAGGNGDLAFAYPLDGELPRKNDKRGFVLLRASGATWYADTLWTPQRVSYVSLVAGSAPGIWDVVYQMRVVNGNSVRPGSLFLAEFDGTWRTSKPSVIAYARSLNWPAVFRVGPDLQATWWQQSADPADHTNETVRWARLIDSATLVAESAPIVAREASEFSVDQAPDGSLIWALRDFHSTRFIRFAYARDAEVTELARQAVPNDAYPHIIAIDGSHFLLLSALLGKSSTQPAVQEIMSAFSIGCRTELRGQRPRPLGHHTAR
jgi:hypothetical protein